MDNFKLIALRPRKGCSPKLLKNISGDQLYPFYSSFKFFNTERVQIERTEGSIAYYEYESKVPNNLYSVPAKEGEYVNGIQFNLAAIAGKNGSGKSSLVDLLFAAVFVMSAKNGLLTPTVTDVTDQITKLEDLIQEYKNRENELKKTRTGFSSAFNKDIRKKDPQTNFEEAEKAVKEQLRREEILSSRMKNAVGNLKEQKDKLKEYEQMSQRTRVDVVYQIDNDVYLLSVKPDEHGGVELTRIPDATEFKGGNNNKPLTLGLETVDHRFFYTIAVNYSHYGLNSHYVGDWIRLLFHKNDGYQTPLVINPMRTAGNFDINSEMSFARTRLLNNVLMEAIRRQSNEVPLTENQDVIEVVFTLNKAKISRQNKYVNIVNGELGGDSRAVAILKDYFNIALPKYKDFKFKDFALRDTLLDYIVNKIDRISENYRGFQPAYVYHKPSEADQNTPLLDKLYTDEASAAENNISLLTKLHNDTSHITFKLHQTINFLMYCIEADPSHEFDIAPKDLKGNKKIEVPFKLIDLFDWTGTPPRDQLIQFLPPAIFEVDFRMSNAKKHSYWFSALSSGEQQFIHTIQSVIYHINNIQSAHSNPDSVKYHAINIVLDEIELYFHPDFQRQFISKLLKAISQIQLNQKSHISTINLLFLTHSPFILSDIPSESVLRLSFNKSKGKTFPHKFLPKEEGNTETFAANIHELLSNSFFIKGTSMGEFAKDKINSLIERVSNAVAPEESDKLLTELIGDKYLKISIREFSGQLSDDQD